MKSDPRGENCSNRLQGVTLQLFSPERALLHAAGNRINSGNLQKGLLLTGTLLLW
jgi:hypothetical protein